MGAPASVRTDRIAGGAAATVALCFGVMIIEGFDIQAMGVAAPALGKELKLAPAVLGQALSASNVGLVFGAILGGWLADRLGRKPVLIGAVATFGLFTLMTRLSASFEMLFWARLLTGLGFGAALPNVMTMAADLARPTRRGSTAAMMFCGMPVGGSCVALLSWLQTTHAIANTDWRVLFLIGGVIPLLLVPALALLMRETRAPGPGQASIAALVPWLSAAPFGIVFWLGLRALGDQPGFGSIAGIAPWLGGVLGLMAAYLIAYRTALFAERRALASVLLWVIFFPTLLVLYLVLNWLPTLVAAKGFQADASLASVVFNVSGVIGALALGAAVDRWTIRWPLFLGFIGLAAALLALAHASDLPAIMALSGVVGFCLLGANYAVYGAAASYYPAEMRGRGSGAAIAWGRLGSVAGPLAGGFLLQGGAPPADVVAAMIPFAVIAGAGILFLTYLTRPET